ncbi:hypothetical protein [Roseovarius sp. D22-M7]|uniref:hypothetical protein n=1 Tax=Roseovarius sp. D22-M7 TaxID=3127116 RepID=UPI003010539C
MSQHRHIGLERRDGYDVGRDPRGMSANELEQLGHARMSPLRALRLNCLDCCNGSAQEVRLCTAVDCPSWPFRMGKNPWRRKLDQEERAALRARLAPKDASAPTAAQKTGSEIDASASDGVRVPNDMADDFSPTEMDNDEGGAS